jgi:hypothetical protein
VILRLERDGVAFHRRASAVAADPRVRQLFERMARQREASLVALEDAVAKAKVEPLLSEGPTPYPFDAVRKVECYACGYVAEEIPASCPSCGAARYAFEKEFKASMAWEIAVAAGRARVPEIEAAVLLARGALRATLEKVLAQERTELKDAGGELPSARA